MVKIKWMKKIYNFVYFFVLINFLKNGFDRFFLSFQIFDSNGEGIFLFLYGGGGTEF